MNQSYFFLGYVTVSADYESITPLLNLCMYLCIPYSDFKAEKERVLLTFRLKAFGTMKKEADARGITYRVENRGGLPIFLEKYKYRFGLWLGIVCAIVLVFLSHQFIWDIEVTGNEIITSQEVRMLLKDHGFSVGSYIPSANTDRIENNILIDSEEISWMSINIIGTVAHVQVRENVGADKTEQATRPANLIAKKSGIIEEVRIFRGKVMVGAGKYVNKGDLLVSGLFDSVQQGFRYTRASGEVLARTVEEFYIEIPYEYEKKEYTGGEYCDKYLNFFDYSMNISKNSRKDDALYDKINIVENYCLLGMIETPLSVKTERYLEYKTVYETRSPEAAEELAYFELENKLSAMADDATLIKKTVVPYARDDRFILHCTVVLIENIAEISEFEVDLDG